MNKEDPESFLQNVALVVVDMQPKLLDLMPERETILRRTKFAVEAASLFGLKIFFTEQSPSKLGSTHPDLLKCAEDGAGARHEVFQKEVFSALQCEPLAAQLLPHGVSHLLLGGIETTVCVYQTALTALEREMEITLLVDCIASKREEDVPPVLATLREAGCYVLPSEAVFYSLVKSASHPAFRRFNGLVKTYR